MEGRIAGKMYHRMYVYSLFKYTSALALNLRKYRQSTLSWQLLGKKEKRICASTTFFEDRIQLMR